MPSNNWSATCVTQEGLWTIADSTEFFSYEVFPWVGHGVKGVEDMANTSHNSREFVYLRLLCFSLKGQWPVITCKTESSVNY